MTDTPSLDRSADDTTDDTSYEEDDTYYEERTIEFYRSA